MDPAAHPIDPDRRSEILAMLTRIEEEHGVRVVYACESGSRGWGFASPDSDYDARFIYVHPLEWYLRVEPGRDVIEFPPTDILDVNGWELRKALGLLRKGNATLIEWMDSPVVYAADENFVRALKGAMAAVFRPERSFHHYFHMARGNFNEYLRGDRIRLKKYFYVLRPLLAAVWVERGLGMPPMRFEALVEGVVDEPPLLDAIGELIQAKRRAGEMESAAPIPVLHEFLERELSRLAEVKVAVGENDFSVLDRLLFETVIK